MASHIEKRFLMMKMFLLVFVFVHFSFIGLVYSQPQATADKGIDDNPISLAGSWKVMQADQRAFGDPSYDDSNWRIIQVPANEDEQFVTQSSGYVWYRKWIYIPFDKPMFNLGLELGKIAFYHEVFVNGSMIGASGSPGTYNLFIEKVQIYQIPNEILHFGGYNLVSVRVKGGSDGDIGIYEGKVVLGDYEKLWTELIRAEAAVLIFSGSFIILSVCVLFFFVRRPKEWEYLFFGLGALDMGIYTFYVSQWRYILGIERQCDFRLYYSAVFFVVPLFLRFTYELLPRSIPCTQVERKFAYMTKGLLLYAGLLVLGLMLYKDIRGWEYVDAYLNNWIIIGSSCIGILYLFYKLARKDKDAIIMFLGSVISFSSGILEAARQYYPHIPQYMATWGVAIFIFSQTILLTNRFLRLHKKVEQYSESLEKMVDTRTEELKIMDKSRRRLLGNISHDLRTPVASVLGHVELLLEGFAETPEQQQNYLKRIHSKMLGLNRLIQDLFELTKIESQQAGFQMSKVAAKEIVEKIFERYLFDVKNAGFGFEYQNDVAMNVMVSADTDRLDQVFANLISNAIRYIQPGGCITISCELLDSWSDGKNPDRMVLLKVADDGIGIAPEHIPNIFERFYRGSEARETSSENSGLGLAIVKEIVVAHGGHIWVDTTISQGCTICFTLPVI
ncbi:ATP-binding protein [Pelosinus sp. sgz500959]|uniref:sensor histidine kinase n=1 Tax=Pelosinus sp. sgz500959 TaxID=3242472 RepID=UPI00366E3DF0